jgi:hypothetical protein
MFSITFWRTPLLSFVVLLFFECDPLVAAFSLGVPSSVPHAFPEKTK